MAILFSIMPLSKVQAVEGEAQLTIDTVSSVPGDTIEVIAVLDNAPDIKSMAISNITYDTGKMTLINVEWLCDAIIKDWMTEQGHGAMTFEENTDANGPIFKMIFNVHDAVADSDVSISCTVTAKMKDGNAEVPVAVTVVPGKVEIVNQIRGDMNADGMVNSDDAVYLLYYTMFGEFYPIKQNGDMDGNGKTDDYDAVYLLYHTMLPEQYPLDSVSDIDKNGTVDGDDAIYLLYYCLLPEQYPL